MLSVPPWCRAQILTKSITAAVLNAIGDLIAQFAVEKKDKLDVGRFVRFAALVSICRAACVIDGYDAESGTRTPQAVHHGLHSHMLDVGV